VAGQTREEFGGFDDSQNAAKEFAPTGINGATGASLRHAGISRARFAQRIQKLSRLDGWKLLKK
jgi:hypothetical protein